MTIAAASVVGRCLDHVKGWLPNDVKICSIRLLEHAHAKRFLHLLDTEIYLFIYII
jgi:hypothetical protein